MKAALFIGDAIEIAGAAAELSSTGEWSMRQTMAVVGAVAGVGGAGLGKLRARKALKPLADATPGKPPQTRAITPYYPINDGFADGTSGAFTLKPGAFVDRYGRESGKYLAPMGTPLTNRALPFGSETATLRSYQVMKPIDVIAGKAVPYFNQMGGGTQYKLSRSVADLVESGHLKRITSE